VFMSMLEIGIVSIYDASIHYLQKTQRVIKFNLHGKNVNISYKIFLVLIISIK